MSAVLNSIHFVVVNFGMVTSPKPLVVVSDMVASRYSLQMATISSRARAAAAFLEYSALQLILVSRHCICIV